MNLKSIATVIAVAKIAEPLITDLEAIAAEVESSDTLKTKVQNVGAQIEALIQTVLTAL